MNVKKARDDVVEAARVVLTLRDKGIPHPMAGLEVPLRVLDAALKTPPSVDSMLAVRRQFLKMWPKDCCVKTTITQGTHTGEKETVPACANDCAWQELARLLAIAEVDVEFQK